MRQQGEIDLIGAPLTWHVFFGACFPPRATATLLPTCYQQHHQSLPNWLLAVPLGGRGEWGYGLWVGLFCNCIRSFSVFAQFNTQGKEGRTRWGPGRHVSRDGEEVPRVRQRGRSCLRPGGPGARPNMERIGPGRMRVRGRSTFTHVADDKKRVAKGMWLVWPGNRPIQLTVLCLKW